MDNSSDDSFLWATASHESSDSLTDDNKPDVRNMIYDEMQNDFKEAKIKKSKKSFNAIDDGKSASKKKETSKTYEKNDTDEMNKKRNLSFSDDMSIDESYLDLKVKHEKEENVNEGTHKKSKKKKKQKNDAEDNNVTVKVNTESYSEHEVSNNDSYLDMKVKHESAINDDSHKKLKKKKKHKKRDMSNGDDDYKLDNSIEASTKAEQTSNINCENESSDSYSNKKVKEESLSFTEPMSVKSKKKRTKISNEPDPDSQSDFSTFREEFAESTPITTKKKKSHPEINGEITKSTKRKVNNSLSQTETEIQVEKNNTQDSSDVSSSEDEHKKHTRTEQTNTSTHRSPPPKRIPDRLTFENDDTDDEPVQTKKSSLPAAKLQQFLKKNTNLTPIRKTPSNIPAVTADDDIWILKLPSEIDIQALSGKELVLDKQCKIKLNNGTYCGTSEDELNRVAAMFCEKDNFVIKNLSLNGVIKFRKRLPRLHLQDDNFMVDSESSFIPLPDTKCRHPLFGPNFKKAMKIPKHISQRLKSSQTETSLPYSEPRKKKKHKREIEEETEVVDKEMSEPQVKKKAKKRKHTETPEVTAKRVKCNPESTEAWDTEKAVEENLFNF